MAVLVSTCVADRRYSRFFRTAAFKDSGMPNAGCSIADELFVSFQQLLTLADRKGVKYDRYAYMLLTIA